MVSARRRRVATAALGLAALASGACAGILGLRPRGPTPFEHRAHALKGVHCIRCHAGAERAGDTGPLNLPTSAGCRSCHDKPHDDRECAGCHGRRASREEAALARATLRFEHRTHVERARGDCVRCHLDVEQEGHALRPQMATCMSCHPHRDKAAQSDCDACHVDLRDEGVRPDDHLVHDPDFLRGHGARAAADAALCASCHTQRACAGCHGGTAAPPLPAGFAVDRAPPAGGGVDLPLGVHRAGFRARHAEEARGDPGLCTGCHAPRACAGCHERERVGATARVGERSSPHPPGWLGLPGQANDHGRAAFRDPALCASCHGGAGEALCVGCHRVGAPGGSPHPPGWTSRLRPRADRPCVLCHGSAP